MVKHLAKSFKKKTGAAKPWKPRKGRDAVPKGDMDIYIWPFKGWVY